MALDQPVALGVGLEVIDGLGEGDAGVLGESLADAAGELGMSVQAAAHRGAADRQFQHRGQRQRRAVRGAVQLPGKTAELLAERQGRGIGQVRAADLEDVPPRGGLLGQHVGHTPARPAAVWRTPTATATWIAVGKMSLVLWPRLT